MNKLKAISMQPDAARISAEASDWLTRQAQGSDLKSRQAFERWIEADPRHLEAYERMARTWDDLSALQHLSALADPTTPYPKLADRLSDGARAFLRPPALMGALALAALAILVWPATFTSPPVFQTDLAEIEPIELQDGTRVTLGARSSVGVAFSERDREVVLREGQAFFEVAHNAERPFIVRAGEVSVRVVGTKFEVTRSATQTFINVQEGIVVTTISGHSATLRAGDRLVVDNSDRGLFAGPSMLDVSNIQPTHVAAWRQGRLAYDDTPLRSVVADLNRYYAPGLELADRATGDIRVTASFRADDVDGFLNDLSEAFPVRVSRDASGRYLLARPTGTQSGAAPS